MCKKGTSVWVDGHLITDVCTSLQPLCVWWLYSVVVTFQLLASVIILEQRVASRLFWNMLLSGQIAQQCGAAKLSWYLNSCKDAVLRDHIVDFSAILLTNIGISLSKTRIPVSCIIFWLSGSCCLEYVGLGRELAAPTGLEQWGDTLN